MGDSCNAPQPTKGYPEVQGSKGRREKTAKTSVFRPGASEPRRADPGRPERASEAKERCSQTDRDRERQRDRDREDVHWRAKPRKRGRGERAENAYLRRNLWGTASFPKSSRK